MDGLTRDDGVLIGFVLDCFSSDAISTAELRQWAEHVVATRDSYPLYLVDLLEFAGDRVGELERIVGFTPDRELTGDERHALDGIALVRGCPRDDYHGMQPDVALAALRSCPHILARFRQTFPFVQIDDPPAA